MMKLQGFRPIPKESNANILHHIESMLISGISLQPLDKLRQKFHGFQQAGSTVLFQQEVYTED